MTKKTVTGIVGKRGENSANKKRVGPALKLTEELVFHPNMPISAAKRKKRVCAYAGKN